jgi:hypothetical protein
VRGDQDAILAENVLTMVELRHQHADLVSRKPILAVLPHFVEHRHQHAGLPYMPPPQKRAGSWSEPACRQVRIIGDVSNKWTSTRDALDDEALDKFFLLDDAIDRLARTVEKQVRPRSCDY